MSDLKVSAVVAAVLSLVSTIALSLYMYYLKVPSRIQAVPSIGEMDSVMTALFSGEFFVYLYHNNPLAGFVAQFILLFVITFFFALGK